MAKGQHAVKHRLAGFDPRGEVCTVGGAAIAVTRQGKRGGSFAVFIAVGFALCVFGHEFLPVYADDKRKRNTLGPASPPFRSPLPARCPAISRQWRSSKHRSIICYRNRRVAHQDRKSTRLNSSHLGISYAVFCLKK